MYANGTLCLYKPTDDPWKPSDNIHEKIIPWTAEWLVFYELYLMCGKWLGPEAPHVALEKNPQKRKRYQEKVRTQHSHFSDERLRRIINPIL